MKRRLSFFFLALLVLLLLAGCGGGDGDGGGEGSTADSQAPTIVDPGADEILISGNVAKGTVLNAIVRATQITDGQLSGTQKDAVLGPNGDFSVSMSKGLVHLEVIPQANSTTQDEATGVAVALPPEFRFRAAADLTDSTAATASLNITPFSEAGVVLAGKSGGLTAANINKANSGIANILGFDHLSTKPIQSSDTVGLANATTNEKKLSVLNAAVSNMAATDALGCGVKASYGEVIDCTIAKLADQFEMNNAAFAQPMAVGIMQTDTANSTPMVILKPAGYEGLVSSIANVVASGVTAFKNAVVEIVEDGIASSLSAATYAKAVVDTAINPQTQLAERDYQALLAYKWDLIRKANTNYKYAVLSRLVYEDKWVNGNSSGEKLPSPVQDYTVLDWSMYGLNGTGTGLQWGAFYNADEIVFAYRGTDVTSLLDWYANYNEAVASCPESTPQYSIALNQFDTLLKMNDNFKNDHGKKKIVLTGHSLGGGIASYITLLNSSLVYKMVGFNSAPLCSRYENGFDNSKVNRITINGEPVSNLGLLKPDLSYPGVPHIPYPNAWLNPITMHSIDTVLFAVRAAKNLCSTTPYCPEPEAPSNSTLPLAIDGLQSAYSTGVTPYRPAILLSGSNLSSINQIAWACTQPNGTDCAGSPYVWTPGNWAGKVDIINDTSIKVYPGLLALGDATGSYNWTATFSALNSNPVARSFLVTYQPQIVTGIVVESLTSTGFTPGTTTISTTTSPVVSALTVTGKNLDTVERIEWRWSGAASGSATWRKSDSTWNNKVAFASDGKLILSPTVVEANPAWSGTVIWTGTLIDAAGASKNITFSVAYQPSMSTPTVSIPVTPSSPSPGSTSSSGPTQSSSTVGLSWGAVSGATYYDLGVKDIATGVLVVNTTTAGTSYSASLMAGKQYRWNVAACNSAGCSSFTAPLYFQTPSSSTPTVPSMPTASSPGSTSSPGPTTSSSTVTLNWGAVSGATYYDFGVRDMATNQLVVSQTSTGTSYSASLSAGKQYRWNVAACNGAGCSSYTAPLYFQIPSALPTVPSMPTASSLGSTSSPGPTTSSSTVTLNWGAVSGATYYDFGVRDMATNQLVVSQTSAGTSFNAVLSGGRQYRWNIAACNSAGCSNYTTPLYFRTP